MAVLVDVNEKLIVTTDMSERLIAPADVSMSLTVAVALSESQIVVAALSESLIVAVALSENRIVVVTIREELCFQAQYHHEAIIMIAVVVMTLDSQEDSLPVQQPVAAKRRIDYGNKDTCLRVIPQADVYKMNEVLRMYCGTDARVE